VLLFVSQQPEARLRDIAERVGITERAVQKIVRDLQDGGLLSVTKHGRCNRYRVHGRKSLRHELEAHCSVSSLVNLIHPDSDALAEAEPVPMPELIVAEVIAIAPPPAKVKPAPAVTAKPAESAKDKPAAKPPARRKGRKRDHGPDTEQGSLF
jgi:DNA-binding Lrp family transcriptional regulator